MSSLIDQERYSLAWYIAMAELVLSANPDAFDAANREQVERILSVAREIVQSGELATVKEITSELLAAIPAFPKMLLPDVSSRIQELLPLGSIQELLPMGSEESPTSTTSGKEAQGAAAPQEAATTPHTTVSEERPKDLVPAEIVTTLQSLARRIERLERELVKIRTELSESSRWPAKFRELQERVERAERSAPTGPPVWYGLGSEKLRERLKKRGYYISEEVCRSLWSGLISKRIIVLEGVPGTGKSLLAKLLPEVLLVPHGRRGMCCFEMSIHPDLSVDEFIGGRTISSDNRIGPCAGPLLDSVLCSHESEDGYWLVMDEFNRCSVDVIFAPLLDALTGSEGVVRHPYMFPDRDTEEARVPIPPSFRIIGTMNPLDRGLFEISQALRQRIQFVRIPTLRGEDEQIMIREAILTPWLSGSANGDRWERLATEASQRLHEVAEQVRELASRQPASQFAACELGSRLVMATVREWLIEFSENAEAVAANPEATIDTLIRREFLRQLEACGSDALQVLLDEVFPISRFPSAHAALSQLLELRRIF